MTREDLLTRVSELISEFEWANDGEYLNLCGCILTINDDHYEFNGERMRKKHPDYELQWKEKEKTEEQTND